MICPDCFLGSGSLPLIAGGQLFSQPFELLLPGLAGMALSFEFGFFGGGQFGLDPLAALLLESQPPPGRLSFGVERDSPAKMDRGLFFQSILIAPEGESPLVIRLVGRAGTAVQVLLQNRLPRRVVTGLAADVVGPLPLTVVQNESQQAAGGGVGGVAESGQRRCFIRSAESPCASHQSASFTWALASCPALAAASV